ncbi:MAG TPA: ABC transporter ATP-binding protein [Beijerinckiaceae bacterium]|jgi:iron(III) transport system ATP-binding protein
MTPTRTAASVVLQGVSKRYGPVTAVKPLNLVIEAGTLVTLLGPSGCGKTTLLRMIAGLERVSEGRILIGGHDVTELSAGERNVSMVFQSYALFPHMSVRENVAYGLISEGRAKREAHAEADAALVTVGLAGFGDRLPSEMSGGQQQRVAVARALVLEPDVLLFDEPLSNLDARLRRSMREEIRALQQRLGLTVVYVTHDQSEALAVSDQIVVMRNAEIAQAGTPRELYEAPENAFVASFMGEANHVKGHLTPASPEAGTVRLGDLAIRLPHKGLVEGEVDVVIRPEAIILVEPNASDVLGGTVATATYMGAHAEYNLDTPVGRLFAVAPEARGLRQPGDPVGIRLADYGVFAVKGS